MALLIPGKESPRNDIDIYLEPLIDELKVLWTSGVPTYDMFRQETFTLRAVVLWIISDFPAYGNLPGWSTHGKLACPHCNYKTESTYLKKGRKYCYIGHCRFLPMLHVFRRQMKAFNLSDEREQAPSPMTGWECLQRLSILQFKYGKTPRKEVEDKRPPPIPTVGPYKKHSIFFKLPYWEHLVLRHCLDVMHIEKNITKSLVATLLGIVGKSKDNLNARLDPKLMGMKSKLQRKFVNGKPKMSPGAYTMKPLEKELFCKVLASTKVPDNYSSNISQLMHVKEKIVNQLQQLGDPRATDDLVALANGPSKWCQRYKIFVCNRFKFKVRGTQSNRKYQNYGVFLQSDVPSYASLCDWNPVIGLVNYYGVLTDVFEIKYHIERIMVLFKCNWFDGISRNTGHGVKTDRYGFRLVNFNKISSPSDPFILTSQALQVFYVQDLIDIEWHVAIKTRPRDFFDMSSTHNHDPCDRQDVEQATGHNDEVRVRSDVDAQDFEEWL
ncbi:uncharacterized protein [Malus domestica]|uniref:uncharacterized protein n=1 Tax=Malus domestica TaxID=3750 RepID=UPI0039752FEE